MLERRVRRSTVARRCSKRRASGACLRILWPPGSEFVAVLAEQLEADLGIGGIALGPAGLKSLAVACGGGRVDRVEHKEGISHEGGDEGAFGLLQAEGDLALGKALGERTGPLRDRFGRASRVELSYPPVAQS